MPILHMNTDLVRGVGNQLQQAAAAIQQQAQQLNHMVQNLAHGWQGPSATIFIDEIQPKLQQLNLFADTSAKLDQRLQREVDEWERVGFTWGGIAQFAISGMDAGHRGAISSGVTFPDHGDREFEEYMNQFWVKNETVYFGMKGLCATASQLTILKSMGFTSITMEDLKKDMWGINVSSWNLNYFLNKFGIESERVSHSNLSSAQNWLADRLAERKGIIIAIDSNYIYENRSLLSSHAVVIVGMERDKNGVITAYKVIDSNYEGRSQSILLIPADRFEKAWQATNYAGVATKDPISINNNGSGSGGSGGSGRSGGSGGGW